MLSYTATPQAKCNNYIFIDLSDTLMGFCLFHVSLNVNVKLSIIRPHHNTTYVDAAYCYRPSSVVCRSVGLPVGLSVTLVSPAKTAGPIEMPIWLRNRVSPRNHVLHGSPDPPWEAAILRGKGASHCKA